MSETNPERANNHSVEAASAAAAAREQLLAQQAEAAAAQQRADEAKAAAARPAEKPQRPASAEQDDSVARFRRYMAAETTPNATTASGAPRPRSSSTSTSTPAPSRPTATSTRPRPEAPARPESRTEARIEPKRAATRPEAVVVPSKPKTPTIERVTHITRAEDPKKDTPDRYHPDPAKVAELARHGGPSFAHKFAVDKASRQHTTKVEIPSGLKAEATRTKAIEPATPDTKAKAPAPAHLEKATVVEPRHDAPKPDSKLWVVVQENKSGIKVTEPGRETINMPRLANEHPGDDKFEVNTHFQQVPADVQLALLERAERKGLDAPNFAAAREDPEKLAAQRKVIGSPVGTLRARLTAIGAEPDRLVDVARSVLERYLPPGNYSFEVDADGNLLAYTSEADALMAAMGPDFNQAVQDGKFAILDPEHVAGYLRSSTEPMPGMPIVIDYEYNLTQPPVPAGMRALNIGTVINTKTGEAVAQAHVTEAQQAKHWLIIAASGAGKTNLIRFLLLKQQIADNEEHILAEQEGRPARRTVSLVLDCARTNSYDQEFADLLKSGELSDGTPLADEFATVRHGIIGNGEVGFNTGLFNVPGQDPTDAIDATVSQWARSVQDPEMHRIFVKYMTKVLTETLQEGGVQVGPDQTGRKTYGDQAIAEPTMPLLIGMFEDVLAMTKFDDESKGNLDEVGRGNLVQTMHGAIADILMGEYKFDVAQLKQEKGVVSLDLAKIATLEQQQMVLEGFIRLLTMYQKFEAELAKSGDDTGDTIAIRLILEEAGGLMNEDTAAGASLARAFNAARGLLELAVIQQNKVDELGDSIKDNAFIRIGLGMASADDRAAFAGIMGVSVEKLEYLASVDPGFGLLSTGDNEGGPLAIAVPNTEELIKPECRGQGIVTGLESLFDLGYDLQYFTPDVKRGGREFLRTDAYGNKVLSIAEFNAMLLGTTRLPADMYSERSEEMLATLQQEWAYSMEHDPDQTRAQEIESGITDAAKNAVLSRPRLGDSAHYDMLVTLSRDDMLAQLHGVERPEIPLALRLQIGLPNYHFQPLMDHVEDYRDPTALPHEDTARFADTLTGLLDGEGNVIGQNASQQQLYVSGLEEDSLSFICDTIYDVADAMQPGSITAIALNLDVLEAAQMEFAKLAGSADRIEATKDRILNRFNSRQVGTRAKEQGMDEETKLLPNEQTLLKFITDPDTLPAAIETVKDTSYPAFTSALQGHIASHKVTTSAPVNFDPAKFAGEGEYPREIIDALNECATSKEQIDYLQRLQKDYTKQRNRNHDQTAETVELLMAPSRIHPGGATLDIMASKRVARDAQPTGKYYEKIAAAAMKGTGMGDPTLPNTIKHANPIRLKWMEGAAELLDDSDIGLTPAQRRFIRRSVDEVHKNVNGIVDRYVSQTVPKKQES